MSISPYRCYFWRLLRWHYLHLHIFRLSKLAVSQLFDNSTWYKGTGILFERQHDMYMSNRFINFFLNNLPNEGVLPNFFMLPKNFIISSCYILTYENIRSVTSARYENIQELTVGYVKKLRLNCDILFFS